MTNPSNQTNPLDYPKYVRGLRPALPQSVGNYVEEELEKIQNSMENMAVAVDKNTRTQVSELAITVDANTAAITNEQLVRASADQTLSDRIDIVEATAGSKIFYQTTAPTGTPDRALQENDLWFDTDDENHPYIYTAGAWADNTDGQITANAAAISSEQQARIDADGTLSQNIDTVSTTVNGNTATISSVQASLNGVEARAGVRLDVNGHVTGWSLNNDGAQGDFIITADRFAVVQPGAGGGDLGMAPFSVIGGVVKINGEELKTNSVLPDALNVSSLSAITATIGTLRTATSGARVEIHDNLIEVFDANNVVRVRMGVW